MPSFTFPASFKDYRVHLVGAKGTGVCALAELLVERGAIVSGSDVREPFYTDRILASLGVAMAPFSSDNIGPDLDLVVYSAAYSRAAHPELVRADALGLPILSYPEALGAFSRARDSSGIAGVHGKTTTTALAGVIAAGMRIPATILAGSAVSSFGDRSTLHLGDSHFIAETCEYRRHFLNFSPRRIVLTSVESDHQDCFPSYEAIRDAFVDYVLCLPPSGALIYCEDDEGARDVLARASASRPDIRAIPYGFSAQGPYRIGSYEVGAERARFTLSLSDEPFSLRVPGRHTALDAAAALALCVTILEESEGPIKADDARLDGARIALASFRGSRRRSEILGEANGVLFMDDYAHHPSAIRTTLAGLREFYPERRIVLDFMSHTYSRTKALFGEFAGAFSDADLLICHKIYASAREAVDAGVSGEGLCQAIRQNGVEARYFHEVMDAFGYAKDSLRPGDLFLTMGAGDNWLLGKALYENFESPSQGAGPRAADKG
jgi:UDP-N-acetylmuramate--alanine ligase